MTITISILQTMKRCLPVRRQKPKASFTTVQVKELGQALEISQLHRSLENISTFPEEKDDLEDLEQSSDNETTSHSKRKAFDSTSKRLPKRRKSEQCNSATQKSEQCSSVKKKTEQCGSPFDPSVNDFLESSEDEDQTDDSTEDWDISTSIFNDDECFGPKVSDAWAKRINEAFSKKPIKRKFKALALFKVCERIALNRFVPYLESNKRLSSTQNGNKQFHSTEKSLVHTTDAVLEAIDKKKTTAVVLLDMSKAFDSIHHNILFDKLRDVGVSTLAFRWFHSYLSNRNQRVRINSTLSEALPMVSGIPQGSIMGPLLFTIYVNALSNVPKKPLYRMLCG